MSKINKDFFKITFQDIEIAKEFFDNEKHYIQWLYLVSEYYQGNILSSKVKIVQKYFNSYKKTMDFIVNSKEDGKKGFDKRVENQRLKEQTLDGYIKPPSSTLEPPLDANYKLLTINNKTLNINEKNLERDLHLETLELFHSVCNDLPKVKKITEKRKKSIDKIIKEHSLEVLQDVFTKVSKSDFLNGKKTNWIANFDWILIPNNFVKILEDNYKNQSNEKNKEEVENPNNEEVVIYFSNQDSHRLKATRSRYELIKKSYEGSGWIFYEVTDTTKKNDYFINK